MIITIIVYSFSTANAGLNTFKTPSTFVKWVYGILLLGFGITILVFAFQISDALKTLSSEECKKIVKDVIPLITIGSVIVALGVINFIILIAVAASKKKKSS